MVEMVRNLVQIMSVAQRDHMVASSSERKDFQRFACQEILKQKYKKTFGVRNGIV